MAYHEIQKDQLEAVATPELAVPASVNTGPQPGSLLAQILAEAAKGRYDKAIGLSRRQGVQDPQVTNARGVCLLRTGAYEEAAALFRGLVLQSGCTRVRNDRPVHFKTNIATALLLTGHSGGCLQVLAELSSEAPAFAQDVRLAIKKWQAMLPWWAWMNWAMARIEPDNQPVTIDWEPGEFGYSHPQVAAKSQLGSAPRGNGT